MHNSKTLNTVYTYTKTLIKRSTFLYKNSKSVLINQKNTLKYNNMVGH